MRMYWFFALAFCLGLPIGILCWHCWPVDPIGPENYRQIQIGMSQAQVEAIIGLPPGAYYDQGPLPQLFQPGPSSGWKDKHRGVLPDQGGDGRRTEKWFGDQYVLAVVFDEDGAVVGCSLCDNCSPEALKFRRPSLMKRIRNWRRDWWPLPALSVPNAGVR